MSIDLRAAGRDTWIAVAGGRSIGTVHRMNEFGEHYAKRTDGSRVASPGCTVNIYYDRDEAAQALLANANGDGLTGQRVRLPDGRTGRVTIVDDRAGRKSATVLGRLDDGSDAFSARAIDVQVIG